MREAEEEGNVISFSDGGRETHPMSVWKIGAMVQPSIEGSSYECKILALRHRTSWHSSTRGKGNRAPG